MTHQLTVSYPTAPQHNPEPRLFSDHDEAVAHFDHAVESHSEDEVQYGEVFRYGSAPDLTVFLGYPVKTYAPVGGDEMGRQDRPPMVISLQRS